MGDWGSGHAPSILGVVDNQKRAHCTYGIDWNEGQPLKAVRIEHAHVMSKVCEYTKSELGKADKKCEGCKHKEAK